MLFFVTDYPPSDHSTTSSTSGEDEEDVDIFENQNNPDESTIVKRGARVHHECMSTTRQKNIFKLACLALKFFLSKPL